MNHFSKFFQHALERGWLSDSVIRWGIRGLLKDTLRREESLSKKNPDYVRSLIDQLKQGPIAINTREANHQHYELPTEFFHLVMGKHMKYSCGYWKEGVEDLSRSEEDMLHLTCERAEISDGQEILELGCGWGSLTLFMAQKFPSNRIMAVSNSRTQKIYIDKKAAALGLKNITVITADMNDFWTEQQFDRVVSVEMFEHMRNHSKLLEKISYFLKDDGRLFVHIFTHQKYAYLYDEKNESDWIAKYFFTGGMMPSDNYFDYFKNQFSVEQQWRVDGKHYQKTSEAWLSNMDQYEDKIIPILQATYGNEYKKWQIYWRVFFMSCAELWGYTDGKEWIVSHYRMKKVRSSENKISVQHQHLLLNS